MLNLVRAFVKAWLLGYPNYGPLDYEKRKMFYYESGTFGSILRDMGDLAVAFLLMCIW